MKIVYKNRGLEKVCTDAREADKKYGKKMAALIHKRIDEIAATDYVEILLQFRIGGCHVLKGKRKDQFAMTLIQPYRLVFVKKDSEIEIVQVIEIVDYH